MLLAKGLIMTGFVAVVLAPLHLSAETVARPGAATIAPSNAGAGSPARNGCTGRIICGPAALMT
jgi:hypothetical protein